MFNINARHSVLKAWQRLVFTLSEVDGHWFQRLVHNMPTARQVPAEHFGHHHEPPGTQWVSGSLRGEVPPPACLCSFFETGGKGPWLHRYSRWDTSVGLSGVQEELLGATSREQSWGGPSPTVIQVTLQLVDSFSFGGNRGDRAIWVVCAYPALSWRYTRQGQDIRLRLGTPGQLNSVWSSRFLQVALTVLHFIKISYFPVT